jgi:hypothetical protein
VVTVLGIATPRARSRSRIRGLQRRRSIRGRSRRALGSFRKLRNSRPSHPPTSGKSCCRIRSSLASLSVVIGAKLQCVVNLKRHETIPGNKNGIRHSPLFLVPLLVAILPGTSCDLGCADVLAYACCKLSSYYIYETISRFYYLDVYFSYAFIVSILQCVVKGYYGLVSRRPIPSQ